ncbi:LPS:glycosyltransferase [Sphaerochaeta pleomorpha str. Grapes]|uniref:LPS:glycosyltransferase n=1 Tax=Sphaerochaeta pleomorpha (strain ATCC BAA-1885 / DSM 22778 / Grapes) TaxID=158190 RepID=G8QS50_SPHPG|nr:glycosyltransferase [Sphaerochaeta pleomorpha]AEV28911.1 LPS:glycosyltransferase [Sphaerochaeta pleomorpha str. Grapes]
MSTITFLVLCHKNAPIAPSSVFLPFPEDEGMGGYASFCSMIRWALAHNDFHYIGFFTQDLYLNFSQDKASVIQEPYLTRAACKAYGLDSDTYLETFVAGQDMVISTPQRVKKQSPSFSSVSKFAESQSFWDANTIPVLLDLVKTFFPRYLQATQDYFSGQLLSEHAISFFKKDLFMEYGEFLFGILDRFCEKIDMGSYSLSQLEIVSFVGNSLTRIFYDQKKKENPALRTRELGCVRFEHADTPFFLVPAFTKAVPVVFASNEFFAPALGVCLQSMLEHCSAKHCYDVVILESSLSVDSKQRLEMMVGGRENVSLRFFDPTGMLSGRQLQKNPTDHISYETYYRFLIADILSGYEKVLYLDCDTVINADVADLYATDLKGMVLGATLEAEIAGLRGHDALLTSYIETVVGLGKQDPYFQAGVLVIDLQGIKAVHSIDEWLLLASKRKYRYNDQDILNKECKGRIALLDMSWNVVVDCAQKRLPLIMQAPHAISRSYLVARENPKIIHYAGFQKPWDDSSSDFAYLFWDYAKRSSFYDRVLSMVDQGQKKGSVSFRERVFPRGSKRRRFAKNLYLRFSKL